MKANKVGLFAVLTTITVVTSALQVSAESGAYIVQPGDTLYSIAEKHNINYQQLKEINNLNDNTIYSGQKIIVGKEKLTANEKKPEAKAPVNVPSFDYVLKEGDIIKSTYKVKAGDNYYTIAKKTGIKAKTLMQRNNTGSPYLYIGNEIVLDNTIHPAVANQNHLLVINLPETKIYNYQNGKVVKTYDIAVGKAAPKWQTPVGDFTITSKVKNPTWYVPASIQQEMARKGQKVVKTIPPGPDNPLGQWWMGLRNGIGIHSTTSPASIGYSASHGCIRMESSAAEDLFGKVSKGTPVKIIYQPVKIAVSENNAVYLEVEKDIYNKKLNVEALAKDMIYDYEVQDAVDWGKVSAVVKAASGLPVNINKT